MGDDPTEEFVAQNWLKFNLQGEHTNNYRKQIKHCLSTQKIFLGNENACVTGFIYAWLSIGRMCLRGNPETIIGEVRELRQRLKNAICL